MNAIFNGVNPLQFKMISIVEIAKEEWNILRVHFEEIDVVRGSRLELLTTKFENLRMSKETISDFNGKMCDIANESFALGEKISKKKIVKKSLRFLPPRTAYKATTLREPK